MMQDYIGVGVSNNWNLKRTKIQNPSTYTHLITLCASRMNSQETPEKKFIIMLDSTAFK